MKPLENFISFCVGISCHFTFWEHLMFLTLFVSQTLVRC